MTEDQIFRERIKNWARAVRYRRASMPDGFLARFAAIWREDQYRERDQPSQIDHADAELLERAFITLSGQDRRLILDWHVRDLTVGKIARRNALFFNAVVGCVRAAERRFRDAVGDGKRYPE